MPVATFKTPVGEFGPKDFPAPKRAAELKYWYKAIRKVIPELPEWHESYLTTADVDVEHIIIQFDVGVLFVARKRRLR